MISRIGRVAVSAATVGCVLVAKLAGTAQAAGPRTVKVTIDDTGCPTSLTAKAGASTFVVTNTGTGGVTEFEIVSSDASKILGEVEESRHWARRPSSPSALKPGDYLETCVPEGGTVTPLGALTVSGTADTTLSAAGQTAVDDYRQYLVQQTAILTAATTAFTAAVDSGNIDAAKAAYVPARVPYERIEPVAETFGDLDPRIDACARRRRAGERLGAGTTSSRRPSGRTSYR